MSSPNDLTMGQDDRKANGQSYQPFTLRENIQQLNEIDKSIAQLMSQTATSLNALTIPSSNSTTPAAEAPALDPPAQMEAFKSATDSFLTTLHSIDVRMKRQIMALEEAGIVNLANEPRQGPNGGTKASLKPNGLGTVGGLDVGWLNSRSTRVEREMEGEMWQEAKDFLKKEQKGQPRT
ncbi:hypothetical protein C2857_004691 [Epichloe festucae Fl1]|uniref:Mediator of RNA polymerase II transcription subunit 11 n=1 Tax=Epichloe festucae (strain Fl1) TaxID=877507 RepID=A0A7S9PS90_EPIFF|nr:hypothetical protein C2857_004691 [Epichloe festucae Fl1]